MAKQQDNKHDHNHAMAQEQQSLNIEIGEIEAQGVYSNLAIISNSAAEFVLDFARILPGVNKAKVHARVIMTPQHAKLLLAALHDNVMRYEQQYGEIVIDGQMLPPGAMIDGGGKKFH